MSTTLLILAGLYLLSQSGALGGMRAPTQTAPRQPATGTFTPGGTRISVPGVGEYINIPGGGVSVTIDPRLYGSLFQPAPAPVVAQPTWAPDYTAWDTITAPVDVFPGTGYAALPVL